MTENLVNGKQEMEKFQLLWLQIAQKSSEISTIYYFPPIFLRMKL